MRTLLPLALALAACGNPVSTCPDGGACAPDMTVVRSVPTMSKVKHLVIVIQENHSFDDHFGRWCTAPTGSNPTCTDGPACCEAAPAKDPAGYEPRVLDDTANGAYSPNHEQACELDEIDGGKMDKFVTSSVCGSPNNWVYADPTIIAPYWRLAEQNAIADRYFQPLAGQSSSNDMYFARANFVFLDNSFVPASIGQRCNETPQSMSYDDQTIGDLLIGNDVPWAFYAEGYDVMKAADAKKTCPDPPPDCEGGLPTYPCVFDPGDVPFEFYPTIRDKPLYMRDLSQLDADLAPGGTLPSVIYIKGLGYKTEHPSLKVKLSDGPAFILSLLDKFSASPAWAETLFVVTYDESGGYFDHIAPPPPSPADHQPYGARIPALFIGPFAARGKVSHTQMEHSSLVKFIEWNWLGGVTGQLSTRDAIVNNIGSVLDPAATGATVPEMQ